MADEICDRAHERGLKVHLDGARIFNAATALGKDVKAISSRYDSIQFCLSKGLGAPVGSLIVGRREFIERCRSIRKMLGGGMRQAGVVAAAGLVALEEGPGRLHEDHANARFLADRLAVLPGVRLDPKSVQTNIVIYGVEESGFDSGSFLAEVERRGVRGVPVDRERIRMVTHRDVDRGGVERAVAAIGEVMKEKTGVKKVRVGVVFGGRSGEHEVSLRSAEFILHALDRRKYDIVPIAITKDGKWLAAERRGLIPAPEEEIRQALDAGVPMELTAEPSVQGLLDVVFPIVHGTFGEDGTIQGFLELADVAYVGAGVLGSAVAMDKDVMKRLLRDAGLRVVDYWRVTAKELDGFVETFREALPYPVFVKPANLGSSVGISKVKSAHDLKTALATAFEYDRKVVVERRHRCARDRVECPRQRRPGRFGARRSPAGAGVLRLSCQVRERRHRTDRTRDAGTRPGA